MEGQRGEVQSLHLKPVCKCRPSQLIKVYSEDRHSSPCGFPAAPQPEMCSHVGADGSLQRPGNWALLELHPALGLGEEPDL
ncbi:hypothetical protein INR49_010091 [Caranx melampygus]|nr:hypothetical protein INR49_010091 [Caranx melampygus]